MILFIFAVSVTVVYPTCSIAPCFFFSQVKLKVSRSLKLMRGAAIRTRKLARDMLVFWKRVDKEMVFPFFPFEIVGIH